MGELASQVRPPFGSIVKGSSRDVSVTVVESSSELADTVQPPFSSPVSPKLPKPKAPHTSIGTRISSAMTSVA